ncbi:MAG: hypothetical protein U0232_24555 [Thermomicrobiales bacterium]
MAGWRSTATRSATNSPRREDGQQYTVQYFERVRLEYHPNAPDPYKVQLGQFGRRIHGGADAPPPPSRGASYFTETGHNLQGSFRDYWQFNGGLAQFGYPITEEYQERLENGQTCDGAVLRARPLRASPRERSAV